MGQLVNKRELAAIFGVTERTFTEWQKEGMPIHQAGEKRGQEHKYDTEVVHQWIVQRELARAQVRSPREQLDLVRTRREELLLRKDLGELVERTEIRPLLDRFVQDNVALLEGMPDKYAALLHQTADLEGKHQLLKQMVRDIRAGLGDYEFVTANEGGGPGS